MFGELGSNLAGTVSVLGFALLTIYLIWSYGQGISGRAAVFAALTTLAWAISRKFFAGTTPFGTASESAIAQAAWEMHLSDGLEIVLYGAWLGLLLRILDVRLHSLWRPNARHQQLLLWIAVLLTGTGLAAWWQTGTAAGTPYPLVLSKLLLCLFALVVVEQVVRNTRVDRQWHLRFLGIGLGWVYLYSVMMYSQAALFGRTSSTLYALQPMAFVLATPLLAVVSQRNQSQRLAVSVSRRFVFRSSVLLTGGLYLLLLLGVATFARSFNSNVGGVLDVTILLTGLFAIPLLLGSNRVRAGLRAFIARNLYEYKYDYRDEWSRVTSQLLHSDPDDPLPTRVIRTLSETIHSPGGALWRFNDRGLLVLEVDYRVGWNHYIQPELATELREFFSIAVRRGDYVIDLKNDLNPDLNNPHKEAAPQLAARSVLIDLLREMRELLPGCRFIVPLQLQNDIYGIAILNQPNLPIRIIWEDYEILHSIARQSAGVLALQRADAELKATLQLQAFEQSSAFVVHDLKSVLAQLQLLLQNAEKHQANPEFVEAMLATTTNATQRIGNLLTQLTQRTRVQQADQNSPEYIYLPSLVKRVLAEFAEARPRPELRTKGQLSPKNQLPNSSSYWLYGDPDRLTAALANLLQNAIDATPANGQVGITIRQDHQWLTLSVADTGAGMAQEFIDQRLFQPFDSTKGLTGMGIGVYQSREIAREMGGEMQISSRPGRGSRFVLQLPAATPPANILERAKDATEQTANVQPTTALSPAQPNGFAT